MCVWSENACRYIWRGCLEAGFKKNPKVVNPPHEDHGRLPAFFGKMDPLSGASTVIAVVSLALEVVKNSKKIVLLVDGIYNAPSELLRLKTLMVNLSQFSNTVQALFDDHRRLGHENQDVSICIEGSLQTCHHMLAILASTLERARKSRHNNLVLSKTSWFIMRKERLKEIEQQLYSAFSMLSTALRIHS